MRETRNTTATDNEISTLVRMCEEDTRLVLVDGFYFAQTKECGVWKPVILNEGLIEEFDADLRKVLFYSWGTAGLGALSLSINVWLGGVALLASIALTLHLFAEMRKRPKEIFGNSSKEAVLAALRTPDSTATLFDSEGNSIGTINRDLL